MLGGLGWQVRRGGAHLGVSGQGPRLLWSPEASPSDKVMAGKGNISAVPGSVK